ncbi:Heparan-alpha-glucosaminide N-acetyltransferase [Sesamum alatum]|uniref:Heparan-alpha-glucosaminide N-acetyltransferase n=1 Tax=Sesamum alatum TaxID=300844 RepID=A0AAE2C985_9LAMI|nr:Heparan-alpha-glucosaminide N-acetyltransferase [Sesamum alatum]
MASYQLIKEAGEDVTLDLQRKDCTLYVEGCNGDVESALQKINPSSPGLRSGSDTGANAASRGTSSSARLVSLDVFRGLTVVLMILVDDAGGILPSINHSPWNGLTLADVVMPFFLFMVGVSLGLVYKNMSSRAAASKKAIFRALKLLILGVFLQGGYFHGINNLTYGVDMDVIRWMGILQRIAVAYLVAAMCEIWLRNDEKVSSGLSLLKKYQWHWIMMFMLTTIYLLLLYGLYVPDWEYQIPFGEPSEAKIFMVKCGVRGDTGPACNAAGMIDRMILGVQHLYRRPIYARTKQCSINSPDYGPLPPNAPSWCQAPFDPEGILSTVMPIVTCLIGLQFGHIIVHFKDHRNRLLLWLAPSSAFIVLGLLCDAFGMHINKALYSFSYTCVTSGLAGLLLATIYLVVDVYGCRRFALVLEWMGMNALLIYILVACNILPLILQGFYWRDPHNNILSLVGIGKQTQ